ncbi:MAG: SufD family Fe-S cluster assembly protein [Ignisphaera sp.]|nr:SufD family Fe-S cluster assembly protein [Ignisphaera sp.]MDW8086245.1 SufD family Fe-S cluster assembly protein [Ignisphaera sp.]
MDLRGWRSKIAEEAIQGLDRPSPYGVDIDVSSYATEEARYRIDVDSIEKIGVDLKSKARYLQVNQAYFEYLSKIPGVEVYKLEDYIENYPDEAMEYVWRLLRPSMDKYVAIGALRGMGGYFIKVKKNTKVEDPIMACMFLSSYGLQAPHNVIIVEDGAEATVYTGCTIAPETVGLHVGLSEFYVGRNAKLRFVMVHSWNRATHVRPRTAVNVSENGEYISYYANLSNVKTFQAYPRVYLGSGAHAYLASIVLGVDDADIDIGTAAVLENGNGGVEIVSRNVARDSSRIVMRASIVGRSGRGHIDCRGLMLSNESVMATIPELHAKSPNAILTHEASIGRLAEDEIYYLMSKGFTRDEAVGILVRGFIAIDVKGIPDRVRSYIETIERLTAEKAM